MLLLLLHLFLSLFFLVLALCHSSMNFSNLSPNNLLGFGNRVNFTQSYHLSFERRTSMMARTIIKNKFVFLSFLLLCILFIHSVSAFKASDFKKCSQVFLPPPFESSVTDNFLVVKFLSPQS